MFGSYSKEKQSRIEAPMLFAVAGLMLIGAAFIYMQAHFLSRPLEELRLLQIFTKAIVLTTIPFLLILKEPDLGSALVFFPISLTMMFIAGVELKYLRRFLCGVGILIALIL